VREIRKYLYEVYMDELFRVSDMETFVKDEIEGKGIIVIDEIDKLVRSPDSTSSTKASDEGVQYDLLPLLDGTTVSVNQKIKINTRNILFVGAGAFEKTKPTELAIELQGRMPIRAKMDALSLQDFKFILTNTEHNLL
jgi:ATP-dependent HslUV protease ATP-binding subunit HslU